MREGEEKRIPLYVINNFLKFERKIYQIFGVKLGRPVSLKGLLYFLAFGAIEGIWYVTPVLGRLIQWLPPGILFVLPITFAWLLTDVGTENRSPIAFFRSLISYHLRQARQVTYVRGRAIPKEKNHVFHGHYTYGIKKSLWRKRRYRYSGFVTYK
ncbi:TcpE family conjugal transfer membrane protein [Virgibacillus sediminis]|uniref:TcpE family conjugal transfer membrane protein n=1 Tax=Virgibacillus sediminis TaxID=202260 RepID=A0ABV7A3K9_9BACI